MAWLLKRNSYLDNLPSLLLLATAVIVAELGLVSDALSKVVINVQPEQVHLSLGEIPNSMVVTWVTLDTLLDSAVVYGIGKPKTAAIAQTTRFDDGGPLKREIYIHRANLINLKPWEMYTYCVGGTAGWSAPFQFIALPSHARWSPRLALVGDMGNKNAQALAALQAAAGDWQFDALLHVGDFAYDMDTDNARVGDEFMQQIEPIAAKIPYMTVVGNHEQKYNFSNYKNRFSMPGGDGQGMYYSFNLGPAHFVIFSSEFYYFANYGWEQLVQQYRWLIRDLKIANENRAERPWIIALGHRPMYCSNSNDAEHCVEVENLVRTGIAWNVKPKTQYLFGLEDLFYDAGVDVIVGAHEHSYERFWPVYNRKVCRDEQISQNVYKNPTAPVHIVTGSGGNQEGMDPFVPGGQPWSAVRSDDYSYTEFIIANATHIFLKQISAHEERYGDTIDKLTIIKKAHGPGLYTCHEDQKEEKESEENIEVF